VTATVQLEVRDRVAHVVIDRPAARNAMDLEVFDQLAAHARTIAADPQLGAVVVRGADGAFSAGLDLGVLAEQLTPDGPAIDRALIDRLQAAFTAFEELDLPVFAGIEGPCVGAGLQLAMACHVRAVAPDAHLSVLEARWGLVPDLGGTWRLPRLVGLGRATELTLSARSLGADEAVGIGLADLTLPADDPQAALHALAAGVAAGPGALRRVPRLLRENLDRDRDAAHAAEAQAQLACFAGPDVTEAVTAAREGRAPRFSGR
jgi:enoyl-CoA hydratase/carnithine racemase